MSIQVCMVSVAVNLCRILDTFCLVVRNDLCALVPALRRVMLDNLAFLQECENRGYYVVAQELHSRTYDQRRSKAIRKGRRLPNPGRLVEQFGKKCRIANLGQVYARGSKYVHVSEEIYSGIMKFSPSLILLLV